MAYPQLGEYGEVLNPGEYDSGADYGAPTGEGYPVESYQPGGQPSGNLPPYLQPQPSTGLTIQPGTGYDEYNRNVANMNRPQTSTGGGFGSKPFFIPSGAGTTGGKVPGQTWGPSGPTGGYMTAPQMGPLPEFKLPIWDESQIESKAQKSAGPGLRELRKGMREAQGRYYENPNVRRMTLRDAMAGYGMGLEKVLGGARKEATAEYAAEYAPQMTKAQMEYQAGIQSTMGQYQNAWKEYLYRMTNAGGSAQGGA